MMIIFCLVETEIGKSMSFFPNYTEQIHCLASINIKKKITKNIIKSTNSKYDFKRSIGFNHHRSSIHRSFSGEKNNYCYRIIKLNAFFFIV